MPNLADGGFVKKYHVALFLNKGTPESPDWFRIKKSTDNTITMNAVTNDYDFIADEVPTTILDHYDPSLNQPLTMIKGQPDYEYFFNKFFAQATGGDAVTEILIVFFNELTSGTTYKAWKSACTLVMDNMNPGEGTITANVNFNDTTIQGTATVTNGVPVFAAATETWFQMEVTVSYNSSAVSGATVVINGTTKKTGTDGKASFTLKDGATYVLGAYDASNHEYSEVFEAASATTTKAVTIE